MSKSKDYEVVNCKDLDGFDVALPDFLFYGRKVELASKNFSTAAAFSPCSAVSGAAWKSSTAPSRSNFDKKRIIIFDRKSFDEPVDVGFATAFIARLKRIGFEIYLRVNDEDSAIVEVDENFSNLSRHVANLGEFRIDRDCDALRAKEIPSDGRLLVIDDANKGQIAWCLAPDYDEKIGTVSSVFYRALSILSKDTLDKILLNNLDEECLSEQHFEVINQNLDIVLTEEYLGRISEESMVAIMYYSSKFAEEIIKSYPDKITAKVLSEVAIRRKELAEVFLERFSDRINSEALSQILYARRDLAERIMNEFGNKFEKNVLLEVAKYRPDLADRVLSEFNDKVDPFILGLIIDRREDLIDRILIECKDKVYGSVDVLAKIANSKVEFYEALKEGLFAKCDEINDEDICRIIAFYPNIAKHLLKRYIDRIIASNNLGRVIKKNPKLADEFLGYIEKADENVKKEIDRVTKDHFFKLSGDNYEESENKRQSSCKISIEYRYFFCEKLSRISEDILLKNVIFDVCTNLSDGGYDGVAHTFLDSSVRGQTFLHVSSVNDRSLQHVISNPAECSSVAVLRISGAENSALLPDFLSRFPKVKHIILSEKLRESVKELDGCSYEYVNFEQYLGSQDISGGVETSGSGSRDGVGSGDIMMASNITLDTISNHANPYLMQKAGEVIKKKSSTPLAVRTEITDGDITSNLHRFSYEPRSVRAVNDFRVLSEEEIKSLKDDDSGGMDIYRFNLPLKKGERYRLPSASASEELLGVMTNNGTRVRIERGDDDFFYVVAQDDCKFSYVVGVDVLDAESSYQSSIPKSHPARKVIDEYMDERRGFKKISDSSLVPEYNESNHAEWMAEVFEKRLGVCRHRVAAVEYRLRNTEGVNQEDVRVVTIDGGKHIALEIKYNGKWYPVDLGGGAANLIVSREDYVARPIGVDSEAIKVAAFAREVDAIDGILEQDKILLESMRDKFSKARQSEKVFDQGSLLEKTVFSDSSRVLVVAGENIDKQANFIIEQARKRDGRPVFYIDSPSKIDFDALAVRISQDSEVPFISKKGLLEEFIIDCSSERWSKVDEDLVEPLRPLLLINWSAFSEQQIAALNTLIDKDRKIHNVSIPDRVQVIGLCKRQPTDYSFLTRHEKCISSSAVKITSDHRGLAAASSGAMEVDLHGMSDYRESLFGRVVLIDGEMRWQKSDFVKALGGRVSSFDIKNISDEDAKKLRYEIDQAKALGYFTYQGFKIRAGDNIEVNLLGRSFEFNKLKLDSHRVKHGAIVDDTTIDAALVNSYLFDALLHGNNIDDKGNYSEVDGIIAVAGKSNDKKLKLFISSELSESQWYCLFYQAEKCGVELELHLATGVALPKDVILPKLPPVLVAKEEVAAASELVRFYVSNNTEKTAANIVKERGDYVVIDVEDFSFQDLVMSVNFKIANDNFRNFSVSEGSLKKALDDGQKVILKGEFSEDLLQMLHPLLIDSSYKDKLVVIFEEQNLPLAGEVYDRLKWMPKDSYVICHEEPLVKKEPEVVFRERYDSSDLDEHSKEKSDAFILERREQFFEMIYASGLVRLIGHSGVGKSNLMKFLKAEFPYLFEIFNEMSSFEEWVKPSENGKTKILFIDESNMEDMHFTMFSDMKRRSPCVISYKGNLYPIDENHKVVFACNPKEYGGGRFDQKLFDDGLVPCMYLQDFPACYIYEKILKESIYDKMSGDVKSTIPPEEFKEFCKGKIKEYQNVNSAEGEGAITVRELQEEVLSFLSQKFNKSQDLVDFVPSQEKDFISTDATLEQERELASAIVIRQRQKEGNFPCDAVGLNGVLVNGPSGCGKSEMIRSVLKTADIELVDYNADDLPRGKTICYKVGASLPLAKKKEIITKAFNEGNLVWIDELDTCIDDGLEKVLNSVMTGFHPDTAERSGVPGFMLISSINDASYDGRSKLSPAILHRMKQIKSKDLKEYTNTDFAIIIENWINALEKESGVEIFANEEQKCDVANQVAKDFVDMLKSDSSGICNLRSLRGILKQDMLMAYRDNIARDCELLEDGKSALESGLRKWSKNKMSKLTSCCGLGQNRAGVFDRVMAAVDNPARDSEESRALENSIPAEYVDKFRLSCFLSERAEERRASREKNLASKKNHQDFARVGGMVVNHLMRRAIKRRGVTGFSGSALVGTGLAKTERPMLSVRS